MNEKIREVKYLDNNTVMCFGENSNKKSSLNVLYVYMLNIATREYIYTHFQKWKCSRILDAMLLYLHLQYLFSKNCTSIRADVFKF